MFSFVTSGTVPNADALIKDSDVLFGVSLDLLDALDFMGTHELTVVSLLHRLPPGKQRHTAANLLLNQLKDHKCHNCPEIRYIFKRLPPTPPRKKSGTDRADVQRDTPNLEEEYRQMVDARDNEVLNPPEFPPKPISPIEQAKIIRDFCEVFDPKNIEEAGCSVCGQLVLLRDLVPLSKQDVDMSLLINPTLARKERFSSEDPIEYEEGPIIDKTCGDTVCPACLEDLGRRKRPKFALASKLWLGDVPEALSDLSFAEKMLLGKVRHNRCVVRVATSGRAKMTSNAIMFASPIAKVYHALPPSREEMEEVLAFIFIGSSEPTQEEIKRCPMLLNHPDYSELEISKENLATYPLAGVPVKVDFRRPSADTDPTERGPLEMSMHEADDDLDEGTEEGPCPFVVPLKIVALNHRDRDRPILGVGRSPDLESMYHNPQSFPSMFPWLFPYGAGGIGQACHKDVMGEREHKKRLLMYHDKRFQTDFYFPMIAFNQVQMKTNVTGSFIFAKRSDFPDICERLTRSYKNGSMAIIAERSANGESIKPQTEEEKQAYSILEDVDH
ncbi:hypothetical protein DFP72DRAFT_816060, partial [Ephemerocybe angulata]